ncbi:MAG: COX15/CtaA family protein [Candidatus Dormiibacterota bacterium]
MSSGPPPTDHPRLRSAVGWLGLLTAIGMFIVLIAGDTVTNTGSQTGCGPSWPLCRGQFIPEFAVSTAIEFTHRMITAAESILVLLLTIGLLRIYWSRISARVLAVLLIGTLLLQAGMGAWAVLQPVDPWVLALHFGFSLLAFAAAVLAGIAARWPERAMRAIRTPGVVVAAVWGTGVYLYALVYSGAYVSHAGAAQACSTWPTCGAQGPAMLVATNLTHRGGAAVALLLSIGLIALVHWRTPDRRDLIGGAWLLLATLVAQGAAGAVLVFSRWDLFGELLHAGVMAFVFGAIAFLCFRVTLRPQATQAARAPDGGERAVGLARQ